MNPNQTLFKYFIYYPVVLAKTSGFFTASNLLEESQYESTEYLKKLQFAKMRHLLKTVKKNNPLYRQMLDSVVPDEIFTHEDLKHLPFISKSLIKEKFEDFMPKSIPLFCTKKTTGGSTGQAVTILKNREAMAYELAATWRGYSWAGIGIGDKQARFWGISFVGKNAIQAKLVDFICNRLRLSAFSYTPKTFDGYSARLSKFDPDYFYGYVSMLEEFAQYIKDSKNPPAFNRLKAIVSTSEVLHDSQRKLFEEVFHAHVYNEYGCGEVGSIAHECEYGNMHISAENMIVEILDGDRVCNPGEIGEIVVTELNNTVFPLIRYRLGDLGVLSDDPCPCKRCLPILARVTGRAYDTIESPDGRKFHGEFFMYVFEDAQKRGYGVEQFQVVQIDLYNIKINIVPSVNYKAYELERMITDYVRVNLGETVSVKFELVDNIPREKSGKLRLIIGKG